MTPSSKPAARYVALFLLSSCGTPAFTNMQLGPLHPWYAPITDAILAGNARFPSGFRRGITTLRPHAGRLWIGYGDATANLGGVTPIEFRWFASAHDPTARSAVVLGQGQGAPQRNASDTGEEQIGHYRICDGALCQPGVDSVNADEAWTQARDPARRIEGNFFRLEERAGAPVWRKYRSVPGGEHVHDLAQFDGAVYAVGSGADIRAEFETGQVFRYLWKSTDGGASFQTVQRFLVPEAGKYDTRFRRLLPVGDTLFVFGYVNPYVDGGPRRGESMLLRGGTLRALTGPLADAVVEQTYRLSQDLGLAIARGAGGGTRTFAVQSRRRGELRRWNRRRIVDVTRLPNDNGFFLLSGDRGQPERFAVHHFYAGDPEALAWILDCEGEAPTALAWFDGALFVGTSGGRVLRARPRTR